MDTVPTRLVNALRAEADILAAWLFGSHARSQARPGSDVDVLVLLTPGASADRALRLSTSLAAELGVPVDVIDIERTSIELASRALCEGRLLFEQDASARIDAEVRVLARAHDLSPLLRRQRKEILQDHDHDRAVERYREALGALGRLRRQA